MRFLGYELLTCYATIVEWFLLNGVSALSNGFYTWYLYLNIVFWIFIHCYRLLHMVLSGSSLNGFNW